MFGHHLGRGPARSYNLRLPQIKARHQPCETRLLLDHHTSESCHLRRPPERTRSPRPKIGNARPIPPVDRRIRPDTKRLRNRHPLANEGRGSDTILLLDDEDWVKNHPALQEGARLQALGAKHTYDGSGVKVPLPDQYREAIDEAKNRVEEVTGLRPTTERILEGFRALGAPPRLKDHMRCIVNNKLKCGSFWSSIPGYEERAYCSFCRKRGIPDIIEDEQQLREQRPNPSMGNSEIHLLKYSHAVEARVLPDTSQMWWGPTRMI